MFIIWIIVCVLSIGGSLFFIEVRIKSISEKLDKILNNAIVLLPQLDASLSTITDYGHLIGVGGKKDSRRMAWLMPPESAKMLRDELNKAIDKLLF